MFLSIQGMYEYDPTIFDGLIMPTYTDANNTTFTLNKTACINKIMLQCGELELLYQSIDTMKIAITAWCVANQESWKKLYASQMINYNPIWNVDADISNTRTGNDIGVDSVQGFNSNTWSEANKGKRDYKETITERRTGNIGVTATQDLIKKEREIAEFNLIDHITESFKSRFCLMVY